MVALQILKRFLRWLLGFVPVVFGALYISLVVLAVKSDSIIFQPQPSSYTDAALSAMLARSNPAGRVVHLKSGGTTIAAFYLPNPQARYTLLFSHGNAEDIGQVMFFLQPFYDAGFSIMAYDYRGYGTSSGKPSEDGVYSDANATYDYVTQELHLPPNQIIAMGRSLGSAAAIHLAATRPVAGLIAEAPFLSAFRVLTRMQILPWDKFNNAREIRNVHVPVLIVHGSGDQVVPFWHGRRLYELAHEPKTFMPVLGAGHNDIVLLAGKKYIQALQTFAAELK